jgi:hypothetical protein
MGAAQPLRISRGGGEREIAPPHIEQHLVAGDER